MEADTNTPDLDCAAPLEPDQSRVRERRARATTIIMVLAFFALALNMRASLTSLPPIIQDIKELFQISGGFAGFLTSIPVLCFGLLTPLIGCLIKNIRLETTVFLTLFGIALGSIVRSAGGLNAAVAGTLIIGIALTAGNVASLMVIGREFPKNINAMTGLYVSGMSWGSMATMGLTAPLSHAVGWRLALASPALLAVAAIILWVVALICKKKLSPVAPQPQGKDPSSAASAKAPAICRASDRPASVLRSPLVWILSVAFAAHTFLFYGLTAWMTVYLEQSLNMSDATAGLAASLFQILGLLGCFGIPLLAGTQRFNNRGLFMIVTFSWAATILGFWLAPDLWFLWDIFGGIGSGGGFTVIFSMIMHAAKNLDENRAMSTVVQSAGYVIASIAPFAIGHLHELAANWQGSMALLTGAAVLMTISGLVATR